MNNNVICLEHNSQDNIGHQVTELAKIISKCDTGSGDIVLDLNKVGFLNPTIILGLSALHTSYGKLSRMVSLQQVRDDIQGYLSTIEFPHGIFPDMDPNWQAKLDSYRNKTYLPLINFPTTKDNDSTVIRNQVISKLFELIAHKLNLSLGQIQVVNYLISELTDNIVDHAGIKRGKILTQYYPIKGYIEICIIDDGKTILGSYNENRAYFPENDKEAIILATNGKSTKSPERGYGIPTSINIIVNGLKGKICLISGSGMLVNQTVTNSPCKWAGTLISIKIPHNFSNFNIYEYI